MTSYVNSARTSPDPLGNSLDHEIDLASRIKRDSSNSPKKPLGRTHGNIKLQDFHLDTPPAGLTASSSPTKSIAQTQNLVSPFRITVTVEAERDENGQGGPYAAGSPTTRLAQRTTTTTVPLKGADDSSPVLGKRGRGRPRKSIDRPIKRKGTPKPVKSVRPKANVNYLEDAEERSDSAPEATPPRKLRGRPRKSLGADMNIKSPTREETMGIAKTGGSVSKSEGVMPSAAGQLKTKGKKAMTPHKAATSLGPDMSTDNVRLHRHGSQLLDDFDRSIRQQPLSAAGPMATTIHSIHQGHGPLNSSRHSHVNLDSLQDNVDRPSCQLQCLPSPEQSISSADAKVQSHNTHANDDHPDPITVHNGYDSIIESEGFSMVSVSTLPSAKQHHITPPRLKRPGACIPEIPTQSKVQGPQLLGCVTTECSRRTSSRKGHQHTSTSSPTSQPVAAHCSPVLNNVTLSSLEGNTDLSRQNMEEQTRSRTSPSPAPENSIRPVEKPMKDTPKLARVVRAGIALRGVLSPRLPTQDDHFPESCMRVKLSVNDNSPEERLNDLFSGFGAGTRRELKAGLRFGKELAKRQQLGGQAASSSRTSIQSGFQNSAISGRPKLPAPDIRDVDSRDQLPSQTEVLYPKLPRQQLPSPERSQDEYHNDQMSWKADTPLKAIQSTGAD
ncbi:MAG: hypothetical protein Q9187_004318, partial [Circinaria calcarea]